MTPTGCPKQKNVNLPCVTVRSKESVMHSDTLMLAIKYQSAKLFMLDHKRRSCSCNLLRCECFQIVVCNWNANVYRDKYYKCKFRYRNISKCVQKDIGPRDQWVAVWASFSSSCHHFRAIIPEYLEMKYYSGNSNHVRKATAILRPARYKYPQKL